MDETFERCIALKVAYRGTRVRCHNEAKFGRLCGIHYSMAETRLGNLTTLHVPDSPELQVRKNRREL